MADLNITFTGVAAANANTAVAYGLADALIKAGQVVRLDTSVTPNLIRLAAGTAQAQAQNVVGIALDTTSGSAQPIAYATAGDVILPTSGAGGTLISGLVYVLSMNGAGSIAPSNDPPVASTTFITPLGLALNATTLRLNITPLGAPR
jgi:hypothetical protein